jgi:hypothetical protein
MSKIQIGLSYKCDRMVEKKEVVYERWNRPFEKFDFFCLKLSRKVFESDWW